MITHIRTADKLLTDSDLCDQLAEWQLEQGELMIRSLSLLAQPEAYEATLDEFDRLREQIGLAKAELRRRRHARCEYRTFTQQRSVSKW